MIKKFNEYNYTFSDKQGLLEYISDKTITEGASESSLTGSQYHVAYNQYITMKSDGTKRVGFVVDLSGKIIHGDFIGVSLELRSIDGSLPNVLYEEFSGETVRKTFLNSVDEKGAFELVNDKQYANNAFGNSNGRLFIGLDVGESGTFSFRFPFITHYAQVAYSNAQIKKSIKHFKVSKTSGSWKIDDSTSYRLFDKGTLSISGNNLTITFEKPFIIDVPQVFISGNENFKGLSIYTGYTAKNSLILKLFDGMGTLKLWNDVIDGASLSVMAVATVSH